MRNNQRPFMNKHILNEIMKRSKLSFEKQGIILISLITIKKLSCILYPLYEKKNQNIFQI